MKSLAEQYAANPAIDLSLAGSDPFLGKLLRYFHLNAGREMPPIVRPDGARVMLDAAGDAICLRPAAVLIPVMRATAERESEIVFTVRTETLSTHAGQVSFPGGRTDADDFDPVHTALRESEEEIGLTCDAVSVVGQLGQIVLPSGFCVTPVVGLVEPGVSFTPSPHEVAAIFHVPCSLVLNPLHYRRRQMIWQDMPRQILELEYQQYRIWGATAAILHHLGSELQSL